MVIIGHWSSKSSFGANELTCIKLGSFIFLCVRFDVDRNDETKQQEHQTIAEHKVLGNKSHS